MFEAYLRAVLGGKDAKTAFAASFGRKGAPDLPAIQASWRRYLEERLFAGS